ncbi:MAG: hypothetical protein BIFFINMI_00482 [Phycisphaerae bacterium]|nr:hypothetical protein [Phycisphaerae bacterium]
MATGSKTKSAQQVCEKLGLEAYPASAADAGGLAVVMARKGVDKELLAWGKGAEAFDGKSADVTIAGSKLAVRRCLLNAANAAALRKAFNFARPGVVGAATSAGLGDRLGLATPAHLAAVGDSGVVPVPAQQSIREMTRTGRTPQQVMDDAIWGVLQAGWRKPWGADADHLKSTDDIDATAAAGFRMFTIDPGDHVDNGADDYDGPDCRARYDALPWDELEISAADCRETYYDLKVKLPGGLRLSINEAEARKAAVKYGRAIAHTLGMYRHLVKVVGQGNFDLEMSVDETESPTSPAEHYFIANELRRLGVVPTSLAPRFVGKFEKGVDYQGDLGLFRRQFALHAAIARELGGYKISLHSGSDKFSVYPIAAELTGGLVHLKTAGTSYLEALRAIARVNPGLYREILAFAISRYDADKRTYHVSADLAKVKRPDELADGELESGLDQFDGRQVLHVTFGSVLTAKEGGAWKFRDRFMKTLRENEETHYQTVSSHLKRHIDPFAKGK